MEFGKEYMDRMILTDEYKQSMAKAHILAEALETEEKAALKAARPSFMEFTPGAVPVCKQQEEKLQSCHANPKELCEYLIGALHGLFSRPELRDNGGLDLAMLEAVEKIKEQL